MGLLVPTGGYGRRGLGAAITPHGAPIIARDDFERSNRPLDGDIAPVGGAWSSVGWDTWGIVSDHAQTTGVTTGMGAVAIAGIRDNVIMSADYQHLEPSRGGGGLFARFQDRNNYYFCHYWNGAVPRDIRINKVVAGVSTNLASYVIGFDVNTGKIGFKANGNSFTAYWNDVALGTVVDASLPGSGLAGMMFWTSSGWSDFYMDNFLMTPVG